MLLRLSIAICLSISTYETDIVFPCFKQILLSDLTIAHALKAGLLAVFKSWLKLFHFTGPLTQALSKTRRYDAIWCTR